MTPLACFYPTRIVLVDDEPRILRMSSLLLSSMPEVSGVCSFERPADALALLHSLPDVAVDAAAFAGARVRDVLDPDDCSLVRSLDLPLDGLRTMIGRGRARDDCSVVVSDFAMPVMDGLEFFARLHSAGPRRVLLTALCDDRSAVDAFNRGLIHRFLQKGDPRGPQVWVQTVREQIHTFFARALAPVEAALRQGPGGQFLRHAGVATLLDRATREGGCRDYCFSADPAGFHLGGGDGDHRFLALADDAQFRHCARIVGQVEGDDALARALLARRVMPVARDGRAIYEHGADWTRQALVPRPAGEDLWFEQIGEVHGRDGT